MTERRRNLAGVVLALGVGALVWWLSQERPVSAVEQRPPRVVRERVQHRGPDVDRATATPPSPAASGSYDFLVTFQPGPRQRVRVAGLPVHVAATCMRAGGELFPEEADIITDAEGRAPLPWHYRDCALTMTTSVEGLGLSPGEEGDVVLVRSVHLKVKVVDERGAPIAGARVNELRHPGGGEPSGRTDGTGRWECAWPASAPTVSLPVQADGFKPITVTLSFAPDATEQEVAVTLTRGRALTVTVAAPGSRLLTNMGLWVESADEPAALAQRIDAPGRFAVGNVSVQGLSVALREETEHGWGRPVIEATVPAGDTPAEVTLTLAPRRLEVCVDELEVDNVQSGQVHPDAPLCNSWVDVRCEGARRLMLPVDPSADRRSGCARAEYAPAGPCVVTRGSCDLGLPTDPSYEPVTVMPPAAVKLRRLPGKR